jgi:type IV secretory pathway protease TraF
MSAVTLSKGQLLGIFLALVCFVSVMDRLVTVTSRSVPYHVCLRVGGLPARGDLVSVVVQTAMIEGGRPTAVTKELKCLAGDELRFDGKSHFCNGVKVDDITLTSTQDGRPITPFVFNGVIPPGKAYVLGEHPHSYDSRYFGFVDASGLTRLRGLL